MLLQTARLHLRPATATTLRAEIEDRAAFAVLLGATVPEAWPPEQLSDALPWFLQQAEASPAAEQGWMGWYGIATQPSESAPVLMASGGFMGPPQNGTVETGYSVLPAFQRQGYATELVGALVDWAFSQPEVSRVIAHVSPDNTPSLRLLRRLGFAESLPSDSPSELLMEQYPR